ncbi:MAG: hypothetical protein QOI50_5980 [Pseudonocardiales bacterium]|jgi:hypothetical protein|uniref:hypothetical protein n=1 Tax=Pseudonocardia sp. Cha107L01 TaxID=3457576 RepID=UPI0028C712CC|nr:hypothetical protein [Pseudonocardiales bacterium]MDT7582719.1 hypothetical protein [Pseudonocardiales bacterium]MDT7607583.1 hypothetical protein [Pseudonocardiales bacterium]MDT7634050.1 hypothetical protein [Pseudonocardiales bacterium]MDT7639566.1 hypothetical protein [Pseudonocardiales bacterium]
MQHTIRRAVAVTVAVGALVAAGAGLAYADSDDDSPSQSAGPGGGSGLSGGPTHTQVLKGAPSVPLSDPTLGESTLLPPVYNAIG